jgi:hypothetical protein
VYVARAEKIRTELLEACDEDVSEDVMAHVILSGLRKAYDTFVRQVKIGTEDLTLSDLKGRRLTVESEVERVDQDEDPVTALTAETVKKKFPKKTQKIRKGACHHCAQRGHWKRDCPSLKKKEQPNGDAFALVCNVSYIADMTSAGSYGRCPTFREVSPDPGYGTAEHRLQNSEPVREDSPPYIPSPTPEYSYPPRNPPDAGGALHELVWYEEQARNPSDANLSDTADPLWCVPDADTWYQACAIGPDWQKSRLIGHDLAFARSGKSRNRGARYELERDCAISCFPPSFGPRWH